MTTLVVIPARLGATRLPRKPLRLLAGVPLVVRVWERVKAIGVGDYQVVATDSREVAEVVHAAGGEAVLTRGDHVSGTDRAAEVAALPSYAHCDTIVNVQGDEPFLDAAAVHGATRLVEAGVFPLGTAAVHAAPTVLTAGDVVKVVTAADGRAMYFSRAPIPFLRDPTDAAVRDGYVLQHLGVYAYRREALASWVELPIHPLERIERLEQLRPLAAGIPMGVATVTGRVRSGVDSEGDLARANAAWRDFQAEGA